MEFYTIDLLHYEKCTKRFECPEARKDLTPIGNAIHIAFMSIRDKYLKTKEQRRKYKTDIDYCDLVGMELEKIMTLVCIIYNYNF